MAPVARADVGRPVFGQTVAPLDPGSYREASAVLSEDGSYRYRLTRIWDYDRQMALWVLLNPSTADAAIDDPTLRRIMGFTRAWGAGGVIVVNLFALRATDPRAIADATDPVGPENDAHIAWAAAQTRLATVVYGWGSHHAARDRGAVVAALIAAHDLIPMCLGRTADGSPRHPLYVRHETELARYR